MRASDGGERDVVSSRIAFPRQLASELYRRMLSGSWALVHEQEADPYLAARASERRTESELFRPLPSVPALEELLDTAYVASLFEEEGRRVTCAFAYIEPAVAASLRYGRFCFTTPLPFTPASVAKLAPAAQPGRTELGVWEEDGRLVIWGLIHHGDRTFAIDVERKPTYFSARILRPGTFTVHFDERLQLLFSRDHGQFFDGSLDLLGTMRSRAAVEPWVATALCRLAQRMLAHGHGGTLLVVEKNARGVGLIDHHALTPKTRPNMHLADAVRLDEETTSSRSGAAVPQSMRRKIEKAHDEALDFVAQLTAVDGAVVLDTALGLLGAGATIQTPDAAMPHEVLVENPRALGHLEAALVSSLGGNRHRSAVCFCAQQECAALALVASQDGDLSYLVRGLGGRVHVLRPYELGVGI
jgi:hypothetical protein